MSILSKDIITDLDQSIIFPWISKNELELLRAELILTLRKIEGHANVLKITFWTDSMFLDSFDYTISPYDIFDVHWFYGSVWCPADADDIISYIINKINDLKHRDPNEIIHYRDIEIHPEQINGIGTFYNKSDHIPLRPLHIYTSPIN